MSSSITSNLKIFLEETYRKYHREEFINPDPLSRVRKYPVQKDREVAAFICAALALGRVEGILKACDTVLSAFGEELQETLLQATSKDLSFWFRDFRYRFFGTVEIVSFLGSLQGVLREYGSLEECFASAYPGRMDDPFDGIEQVFKGMRTHGTGSWGILLSDPSRGGGMKRWHLFLRWMVREDGVDPGGWTCIPPAALRVPVDTHLYRWSVGSGFTQRRGIDRTTVEEITRAFRKVDPNDPVRFDFSLSRLGIHPEVREVEQKNLEKLRESCHNRSDTQ
ncbi:MAG: TIGR02757 family protein [Spirochaetales bacterium]